MNEIRDIVDQHDLETIVAHAATQLAGHFWTRFPEPLRAYQRHAQLLAFDAARARATSLAGALAEETFRAWSAYRSQP